MPGTVRSSAYFPRPTIFVCASVITTRLPTVLNCAFVPLMNRRSRIRPRAGGDAGCMFRFPLMLLDGKSHRLVDLHVARAAAEVARKRFPNLVEGWVGIPFQKRHRRDHETWCTKPALRARALDESFLHWIKGAGRAQTLNRRDFAAFV